MVMNLQELLSDLGPKLKPHWMPLTVGIAGIVLLLYGLISMLPSSSSDQIVIHSQEETMATTSAKISVITIDVAGAVKNPGVYEFQSTDRIQDAIEKAGGFSEDANAEYVSKNINLAQKLIDGGKLYVPHEGEAQAASIQSNSLNPQSLVNINTASSSMLEDLPGIGKVTAEKIINGRPYTSIQELLDKKNVGSKVFEQIKDRITVN